MTWENSTTYPPPSPRPRQLGCLDVGIWNVCEPGGERGNRKGGPWYTSLGLRQETEWAQVETP